MLGDRLTTILVCQGKYAEGVCYRGYPMVDLEAGSIADLQNLTAEQLIRAARAPAGASREI